MQDAAAFKAPKTKAPKTKGRWQLALVILIPSLAMGLAWFLYFFGIQWVPDNRTNKGELFLPPVSMESLQLSQGNKAVGLEALEGRWGVLVFGDSPACESKPCQELLYQTRQAHIALGRETDRVVRIYVSPEAPAVSSELQEEHPGVLWMQAGSKTVQDGLKTESWPANGFYIVDPLGNIMMKYQPGQYGGDLLKDLRRLLKVSKIG